MKKKIILRASKLLISAVLIASAQQTLIPAVVHATEASNQNSQTSSTVINDASSSSTVDTGQNSEASSSSSKKSSATSTANSSSSNKSQQISDNSTQSKTVAPRVAAGTDAIGNLVSHGYALGVASNFNIFASNEYTQSSNISNARIAAGMFKAETPNRTIGWNQWKDTVDKHILVVGQLASDENTVGTILDTNETKGVYASENGGTPLFNGTAGKPNQPVTVDPLSSVWDFTDNGLTSFGQTQNQLNDVSNFYATPERLLSTFPTSFVKDIDIPKSDFNANGGLTKTIDDTDDQQPGLLAVNLLTDVTKGNQGLITDSDRLDININFKTNNTKAPIVVLNFPNITGDMLLPSSLDISLKYGPTGDDYSINPNDLNDLNRDKYKILLNFPKISTIRFNGTAFGSVLAPNADVYFDQLNTNLSAVAAHNITLNTVTSSGSEGIFNPGEFGDPPDHSGDGEETKVTKAEVNQISAGTTNSLSFIDQPQTLNVKYQDKTNFNLGWTSSSVTTLYRSTDQKTWRKVDGVKTTGQQSVYKSEDLSPGKDLTLGVDSSDGTHQVFTATNNRTTTYFALIDGANSPDIISDTSQAVWHGQVSTVAPDFTLSVPNNIEFTNILSEQGSEILVTPDPAQLPEIKLANELAADFTLSLQADNSDGRTQPIDNTNAFSGSNKFQFISEQQPNSLLNTSLGLINNAQPIDGVLRVTQAPLAPVTEAYQLTGLQLTVPQELRTTAASIGLDWRLVFN